MLHAIARFPGQFLRSLMFLNIAFQGKAWSLKRSGLVSVYYYDYYYDLSDTAGLPGEG